ncbi:hypothetical protein [Bacillus sp. REN3]|uniref:hypothetical protein n=1 Tax=Bacillus sp. REN3 TaxID=2802440 RepID=UPI001FEE11D5|nr:hypothetical protein [Bacillus sp. REN3]
MNRGSEYITEPEQDVITIRDARDEIYQEETAAEIATPAPAERRRASDDDTTTDGRGLGYSALALSILSLFILPVLFGAAGIVLGIAARRRGAALGSWAIGIGTISILIGLFILPFF